MERIIWQLCVCVCASTQREREREARLEGGGGEGDRIRTGLPPPTFTSRPSLPQGVSKKYEFLARKKKWGTPKGDLGHELQGHLIQLYLNTLFCHLWLNGGTPCRVCENGGKKTGRRLLPSFHTVIFFSSPFFEAIKVDTHTHTRMGKRTHTE